MIGGEKARPSASAGSDHVLESVEEHVGASRDERVEQQETGDATGRAKLEARRPVKGKSGQTTPNSEDEMQAPEKFGHRQQHDRAEIGDASRNGAAQMKQQQPAGEAEPGGDQHGERGELDGGRQRLGDQGGDVAAEMDRACRNRRAARRPSQIRYCCGSG